MPNLRFKVRVQDAQAKPLIDDMRIGLGQHSIGSNADCAIHLPFEGVEPIHASLTITVDGIILRDMGSSTGTFLGSTRISGELPLVPFELETEQGYIGIAGTYWIRLISETGTRRPQEETTRGDTKIGTDLKFPKRYKNLKLIGEGGQGKVYRARDKELDMDVALKVLRNPGDEDAIKILKEEVRKCLGLSHENIVGVYDYVESPPSIKMEFVEGEDLNSLKNKNPGRLFSWNVIEPYVRQLCSALSYAHKKGIVHRDIKPHNIFSTQDKTIKLGDFGIAVGLSDSTGQTSKKDVEVMRTPQYCSPQQLNGRPISKSDDIYSVGATIYELLTGTPPFYMGYLPKQIEEKIPESMTQRLEKLRDGANENEATAPPMHPIPDWVEKLVSKCLAKEEEDRPKSVDEMERVIQAKGRVKGNKPLIRSKGRVKAKSIVRKTIVRAWALAASVALAGLFAFVFLSMKSEAPQIISGPEDVNATSGDTISFTVNAKGESITYKWYFNGRVITDATNKLLTVYSAQANDAGNYHVMVGSTVGSTNSAPASLFVFDPPDPPPPKILVQPEDIRLPEGEPANFSVKAEDHDVFYQWFKDGKPLQGQTNSTLNYPKVQKADTGKYWTQLSNKYSSTNSNPAILDVIIKPHITTHPDNKEISSGAKVAFRVDVEGTKPIVYQWKKDSTVISGSTNAIYEIRSVKAEHAGSYLVIAKNEAGETASQSAQLKLKVKKAEPQKVDDPVPPRPDYHNLPLNELKEWAEKGDEAARWELYSRYYEGRGDASQDYPKARAWLRQQTPPVLQVHSKTNSTMADFELGRRYFGGLGGSERNHKKAHERLRPPAERGDPEAQFMLGEIVRHGLGGIPKDLKEAFGWHQKAAKQNHASAQFKLGQMYEDGEGTDKDIRKAIEWYKRAAENSIGPAQLKLSQFYSEGIEGVEEPDQQKAFSYELDAVTNLKPDSNGTSDPMIGDLAFNLAQRYESGNGTTKDLNKAVRWYETAAEEGKPTAEYRLGKLYLNGKGVGKDKTKAIKLFTKSAKHNIFEAQLELGKIYHLDKSLKSAKEAERWLGKVSAQKPDSEATLYLASIYLTGTTGEPNPGKTRQILEQLKSERSVHGQAALYLLGMMHLNGLFGEAKRAEAMGYFTEAADLKSVDGPYGAMAAYMLGILYYEGNAIYDGLNIREESKKKRVPHQKELSNKYFTQAFQKIYLPAKAGFSLAQIHVAFASYTEYLPKRNIGERDISPSYAWLVLSIQAGLPKELWGGIDWQFTEEHRTNGLAAANAFLRSQPNRQAVVLEHPQDISIVDKKIFARWWGSYIAQRKKWARNLVNGVLATGYVSPNP